MTPEPWISLLLVAIPPTIAAVGALVLGYLNRQKLQEMHVIINSRLSALLETTSRAEHAEGQLIGGASAADIQRMIDAAFERAISVPPTLSSEALTQALVDRAAVVAVALTDTAAETAAHLNKGGPTPP